MRTKYQRALWDMKEGRTWQWVADELTLALGETVHRAEAWSEAHGKYKASKVRTALEQMGLIPGPRPRFRLACEFESEEEREFFRDYYYLKDGYTFSNLIHELWDVDKYGS